MNNERRKAIAAARALLEAAFAQLEEARSQLEDIRDEEQSYFDDMPESFQGGDRGQKAEEAVSQLDAAISDIECMDFEAVYSALEEASQ